MFSNNNGVSIRARVRIYTTKNANLLDPACDRLEIEVEALLKEVDHVRSSGDICYA